MKKKFGDKCSDYVAAFGGSWRFIFSAIIFLAIWMSYNLLNKHPFDPPPFIGLNLILSCIAAFQAPFILMSQNRQSEMDRKRDIKDLNIDIESNIKIKEISKKIDGILTKIN